MTVDEMLSQSMGERRFQQFWEILVKVILKNGGWFLLVRDCVRVELVGFLGFGGRLFMRLCATRMGAKCFPTFEMSAMEGPKERFTYSIGDLNSWSRIQVNISYFLEIFHLSIFHISLQGEVPFVLGENPLM